jgi:tetratricopeptide (TPR) repeat protein
MFQVETEIAQRVATSLEATLSGVETRALQAKPTASVEAHQAFLKGRYCWNKRTYEGYKQAVEHFRRAIEIDPLYAQAHAGLADALMFLAWGEPHGPDEMLGESRAALNKALALNDTLADAHASLGLLAMNFDWDWPAAEREFKEAIASDPNYATAHHWYGEFLVYMGRFEEAFSEIKRAHDLDPLSLIIATDVAKVYIMARRYDEAISQLKGVLELDPNFPVAHALLGMTYSFAGRHEEAIGELRQIKNIESDPAYLSFLGYAYGAAGKKGEGETTLNHLKDLSTRIYVSPLWMAVIHAGLGRTDEAFHWLERVFQERAGAGAVSLKVNPSFDSLRSDPRFADLLRRAKLMP